MREGTNTNIREDEQWEMIGTFIDDFHRDNTSPKGTKGKDPPAGTPRSALSISPAIGSHC